LNWGWATIAGGAQSMARTVTYHPVLKQLVYSPAEEYSQLHEVPPLATQGTATLKPGVPLSLGKWKPGVGNSSDVNVSFALPAHPVSTNKQFRSSPLHCPSNRSTACQLKVSVSTHLSLLIHNARLNEITLRTHAGL
jgi:hypothetical protein